MREIRRTRKTAKINWKFDLIFAALGAVWIFMETGGALLPSRLPQMLVPAVISLAVGTMAFGLPALSRSFLDGSEAWIFDDTGYRYSRESRLWPATRQVAYADIAHIQVIRLGEQTPSYGLTLVLRSGKTLQAGVWDYDELSAVRDVLTTYMPGSNLPLPT